MKCGWYTRLMQAYTVFDKQVGWDVPPILLEGREKLRVVAYFGESCMHLQRQLGSKCSL